MKSFLTLSMLLHILNNKKVTAKELSIKYEYSIRTIYRYLDQLLMAGVPLETKPGVNGGITIADNFKVNNLFFTDKEIGMIKNGLHGAQSLFAEDELSDLLDKLDHLEVKEKEYQLSTDEIIIDGLPWGNSIDTQNKISVIKDAIAEKKVLTINYHDRSNEKTRRDIEPHTLVIKNGVWYLIAYCHLKNSFRSFKVSRIETILITDNTFERKTFSYHDLREMAPVPTNTELILEVNKKIRSEIEDWIGSDKVVEQKDKIIATISIPITDTLVGEIMSFGDGVKVLAPETLIMKIREKLKKMETLY